MNTVSHRKKWNTGTVQVHVKPTLIPLIKSKNYEKPERYFVKIELCRDSTSEKLDLYELKIASFDKLQAWEALVFCS